MYKRCGGNWFRIEGGNTRQKVFIAIRSHIFLLRYLKLDEQLCLWMTESWTGKLTANYCTVAPFFLRYWQLANQDTLNRFLFFLKVMLVPLCLHVFPLRRIPNLLRWSLLGRNLIKLGSMVWAPIWGFLTWTRLENLCMVSLTTAALQREPDRQSNAAVLVLSRCVWFSKWGITSQTQQDNVFKLLGFRAPTANWTFDSRYRSCYLEIL